MARTKKRTSQRRFGSIRQLPSGRFQARYLDPATGERVKAPRTFAEEAQADVWLSGVETDMIRGVLGAPSATAGITTREWSDKWLELKEGQRANTRARDEAALAWALPIIGDTAVADVSVAQMQQVVAAMRKVLKPSSVERYTKTIGSMFTAAIESDLRTQRTPVREDVLGMPKVRKSRRQRVLSPEELRAVVDQLGATDDQGNAPNARYQALVLVAGITGLRWGEVIALRPMDVNMVDGTITVAQTVEENNGKVRVVPITKTDAGARSFVAPPLVLDAIAAHLLDHRPHIKPNQLIFTGPTGAILRKNFNERKFKPACEAVGIPVGRANGGMHFHQLRKTAATYLVDAKVHVRVMQSRLGHTDPRMSLGIYAQASDPADREAADRLQSMMAAAFAN